MDAICVDSGCGGRLFSHTPWSPKVAVNDIVRFETEVLNDMRSSHADLLEAIANEKELSKENDDKLKSILDNIVEKFTSN